MAYAGVNASGQAIVLPVPAQPGLTGATGRDGEDGSNGLSAYQIAVQAGFAGTEQDFAAQLLARAAGVFARSAATRIPARRMAVDLGNGLCGVVNPADATQAGRVLGIVLQDTPAGALVTIQQGELGSAVQFAFGRAGPLYIADDGSLTLTPRTSGFSQIVGWTPDGITAVIALGQARQIRGLNSPVTSPLVFVRSVNGQSANDIVVTGDDILATIGGVSDTLADHIAARAPAASPVFSGAPSFRDNAGSKYLNIAPGTLVASQSPWDPTGVGIGNLRAAQEMKYLSLFEDRNEFASLVHLRVTKGRAAARASQPGGDKVALAPTITAMGDGNNGSIWCFNPILNAYAGAAPDVSYIGAEYDLNNLSGKHFGDTAPLEGDGNFIGILVTGLGFSRKTAAIMVTDVADRAWNYGVVVPTSAIAAAGSTFADFCNGHAASLDIRGSPLFGVRQVSNASRNWLNGATLIGNYPDAAPQSRLHVEGGAVGGGVGQFIEVFRRGATVDSDSLTQRETVYRLVANTGQQGAGTAVYRTGLYRNGEAAAVYVDQGSDGTLVIGHGAAGASLAAYADLRVRLGGNVDLANCPTADPHVVGRLYRSGSALQISLG